MSYQAKAPEPYRGAARSRSTAKLHAVLRAVHGAMARAAMVLAGVLRIVPIIGRLGGQARYWIAYLSLAYFIIFWIKQGICAMLF